MSNILQLYFISNTRLQHTIQVPLPAGPDFVFQSTDVQVFDLLSFRYDLYDGQTQNVRTKGL